MKIGNLVYYVQRNGKTIREFGYSYDIDEYTAFDATLLAEHITDPSIVDMDYQQSPYNILWCVRSDGQLVCLTRQVDQEVIAWSRQILGGSFGAGDAIVESVAVIPGDGGDDEVWVSVKRTIDSSTVRYIEYFKPMDYGDEQEDAFFVDSGLSHDSPATITAITKADPGVVTAASHGFTNGDIVLIRGVKGMTEVNGNKYAVANKADNTFELNEPGETIDANTKLLLHFNGTDGSTTFTDSSVSSHAVTANGNAQIDTAQSKFGGGSLILDGTGDFASIADTADVNFGSGDFTIDFRVRFTAVGAVISGFCGQYKDTDNHWSLYEQLNTNLGIFARVGGTTVIDLNWAHTAFSLNTWYHIEVNRNGNNFIGFVNGTLLSTETDASDMPDIAATFDVGRGYQTIDTPYYVTGHIDEFRAVKGVAKHTASFTVAAEAYASGADVDTTDFTTYISDGEARECVSTLSGLDHLEGETVNILIDGIARDSLVVASGAITITTPTNGGGEIHAGLEYTSTIKTMRIEAGSQQGTAQSKLKRIAEVFVRVYRSIKMNVGNSDSQDVVSFDATDDWIPEFTGDKRIHIPSSWDRDGYIVITQSDPLPLIVTAIIVYLTTSDR